MRVTNSMLAATLLAALAVTLLPGVTTATTMPKRDDETTKRLNAAADVLREIMATPDKGIPADLLDKAACVVVVPNLKKGAFIVGAKYGRGFIVCRNDNGHGWSAPAGVIVEGGSVGFQIGGSETDVVMLLMNESAIDKLLTSKFTIGGDVSVAAGPVGRTTSADTDAQLSAELLTYSRTRGLFAGVSLHGATLRPDDDANSSMYGGQLSNKDILLGEVQSPRKAARLTAELNEHFGVKASN